MQWYASFESLVMAFLTEATPAHEFGSMKGPLPSNATMFLLSITHDPASRGLRTLARWNVIRLKMSPPCRSVHRQSSQIVKHFSPPGPTYRCPFTSFEGFRSSVDHSSGFTTDSSALESSGDVSVPTPLAICFNRFTVVRHVTDCDCIQVHLVRPPLSIIGVVTRGKFKWNSY